MADKKYLGNNEKLNDFIQLRKSSLANPEVYWKSISKILNWSKPFNCVTSGSLENGDVKFFEDGQLNACYNCVDRHLNDRYDQIAIISEGDDPTQRKSLTFSQLHREVCRMSNLLRRYGISKGDIVCIYLPMIPEAAIAMLACARIGAPHSVVFAGFSATSLGDRLTDSNCKLLITSEFSFRGGKKINLLEIAKDAVQKSSNNINKILVYFDEERNDQTGGLLANVNEEIEKESDQCEPVAMDSEDPLFLLYTSGSTGKPKGMVHSTGGYLVYAAHSHKIVFDVKENDIFGCVADVGWITGHSYVIYGPLANGCTTFMFQSSPLYPDFKRYWEIIKNNNLTQFYTSPTAIRAVQKMTPSDFDLQPHFSNKLRVLGTVGEPINQSAWHWFFNSFGHQKIPIVDTYWQTETGGIVIAPLPGITPLKSSSATFPLPGIDAVIIDPITHKEVSNGQKGVLCLRAPWPGMARTIHKDHDAFKKIYLSLRKGYYYTGDGAYQDEDGYFFITGRVDDVISISGHRLGTAEIETALSQHSNISECAVVSVFDEIKGQKWLAFVVLKDIENHPKMQKMLNLVRENVGRFAAQGSFVFVKDLPKTRSGKIMRRTLRKILAKEHDSMGDVSTLTDPSVIDRITKDVIDQFERSEINGTKRFKTK